MKCNQSLPGFELVSPCPFPRTITIIPRTFPTFYFYCWLPQSVILWLGLGDLFIYQNLREFYASHFRGRILVCANTIWQYVHNLVSCTIPTGSPFPTQSYLAWYSFCASLLHWLTMRLIILFYFFHNVHLLICFDLSIFILWHCFLLLLEEIQLLTLDFPFINHVHVFLSAILLVYRLKYPYSCFSIFSVCVYVDNAVICCRN